MSQSFNGYNGAPQNSHPSTRQTFEGLSGSLILPNPSTPVQPNYGQAWPGPQGWQNHGQNNFNFGLTYPPPPIDTGTYFPNHQEDFVPFDKSANFYENDNTITNISAGPRVLPLTHVGEGEESDTSREQMKSRLQELMRHPAMKRPLSEIPGQPQTQHTTTNSPAPKPDANALNDRAAELRAKLLATKRGSTPVAPSSVPSKPTDPSRGKTDDVTISLKPTEGSQAAGSLAKKTTDKAAKSTSSRKSSDIPSINPSTSSLDRTHASTDIDGLFAEARAAVAAGSTNMDRRGSKVGNAGIKVAEKVNKRPPTAILVERPLESSTSESHRRSLNNSTPSSEMSELGEIRSDSGKPSRTSNPSEATKVQERRENREQIREIKDKNRNFDEKSSRQTHDDNISKQTTKTYGQEFEAGDVASPKASRNGSSTKADLSTPQHAQNPKVDNRLDRDGRPSSSQEPRRDNEQVRRQGSTIQENGNRSRSVSGYQPWSPFDRDRNFQPRDGEGRRPQPPRYDVNESARAAAEYKRELEARRQQAASHKAEIAKDHNKERAEQAKDYKKKERESAQQAMPKKTTSETQQYTPNSRANDQNIKSGDELKTVGRENRASVTSKELSEQENNEKIDDVRDWLEMTGYFDVPYRKKGLARFRKIRALDIERAELEREAQLDFEGRSHFARSQSAFPRESVERSASGSLLSPQVLRSSISSMPPPPVPTKETPDDMGIKIKDSANRESFASRRANEDGMRSASKHYDGVKTPNPTLKRHHEPDDDNPEFAGARPADKLARTDRTDRADEINLVHSPVRGRDEAWARENHETKINESRVSERRGRRRSPESRNRSGSPTRGRTFGYDKFVPSQPSRVSPNRRNLHSPDRHGNTRHTASSEKPKEVNHLRCHNCDQADHSAKDCPESINQRDNVAKEVRPTDTSQTPSYSNKKYDIKKEEERDYQPLEDEHQDSRPSTGYYHYHHPNNYRGRGRGRGGYISANSRGGFRPSRIHEGNLDGQHGNGGASLNLGEGG